MEAKNILEKIEGRIKEHYILSEIYKRGNESYIELIDKYGKDTVCSGTNFIEAYKLLCKLASIREENMKL